MRPYDMILPVSALSKYSFKNWCTYRAKCFGKISLLLLNNCVLILIAVILMFSVGNLYLGLLLDV